MLNGDQVGEIIRALLAAAGGWAIGKGYIDKSRATTITGALVTIVVAGWSYYTNKPARLFRPHRRLSRQREPEASERERQAPFRVAPQFQAA
jgi:hypothetical protein